ncbi:MAG: LysM peptidoglycan-binding domain-containing protein [Bacteroidetes bacterium]|nr:LysM peptidoglycan-binding domain-containing protein [Bacteroidota bacterium]MBU1423249.1 LysM peptidoglycan-binding domain-containing protein [Bacteroidota bacterium]MBU2472361.1 LysM peptidoglycan-binding domain-containing protein [Bacteroidota bacterium]MBU2635478.1 LysM peptidoglycan-binding domain-containing protein [Bacteroidota bacterium]
MKSKLLMILIVAILLVIDMPSVLAQEMTKEQWQQEMSQFTAKRNDLKSKLDKLNADIKSLQDQSQKLDGDLQACMDEKLELLGVTQAEYDAFFEELARYESRVSELMKMSDEELLKYRQEVENMNKRVAEMAKHKIAMVPRQGDRIKRLQENIASLMLTLGKSKTYTVGTWAKDRDCLWNIAKKKDIYNNAWLWPKIWQGNRDKIKNPDVIKPKWVLKIPHGTELTKEEKSAANSYYKKKAAPPAAPGQ